jgi:hypothetical protein
LKKEIAEEMENIFKRIWSNLHDGLAPEPPVRLGQRVEIGRADLYLPNGWQLLKRSEDVVVARSPNGQQATVSLYAQILKSALMRSRDFVIFVSTSKSKAVLKASWTQSPPSSNEMRSICFSSEKTSRTVDCFSGICLRLSKSLVTIYVEGVGVDPRDHLQSFAVLVRGLRRR